MQNAQFINGEFGLVVGIFILSIFLGLVVLLRDSKKKANIYFLVFSVSCAILVSSAYFSDFFPRTIPSLSILFSKFTYAGVILMASYLFLFSLVFPSERFKQRWIFWLIYIYSSVLALLTLFTSLLVKGIELTDWGFNVLAGPIQNTFFLPSVILLMVISIINFIYSYVKSKQKSEKIRIRYLFYGFTAFLLLEIVFNVLLPVIINSQQYYRFGNYSFIIFLIFVTYSITRHSLFNIKVIATEFAVVVLSGALFIEIFIYRNVLELVLKTIIWVIATYGGYLLIKSVISEIERRKEVEELAEKLTITNTNLLTLQHINNKMVSTLELRRVAQEIVEALSTELSWKGGFVALLDEKEEKLSIAAISRKVLHKISPYLTRQIADYHLHLSKSKNVLINCIKKIEIEYSDNFYGVIKGALKKETAQKIQKALKVKTFSCAPVVYRGRVIGAIVIGFDKELKHISDEERKMISSIADQAAIAIENAKLYEQIEAANKKLRELDELKNEFLSIASHQVRTPLSIIKGYISLLRSKKAGKISGQQDHFLKNIQEANEQLLNIINDFLNLSRIEQKRMKLEITEADVKKIIEEVIERLSHEAELKKIKLKFEPSEKEITKINIDEPKMVEVITNLIDNAIKYSPEESEVKISLEKEGRDLKILVKDSGIGIPDDFKEKLFQKFSRAHNAIQHQPNGNGIGLFLVKKIIDAHRGSIAVSSKEGKGTTFTVCLNYKSGLKPGEEIDATQLEKEGIIRYNEYKQ